MKRFDEVFLGGDPAELRDVLSEHVTFRSPAVFTPYEGVEAVLTVLLAARKVLADAHYVARLSDGDRAVFFFEATVDGLIVEGVDSVVTDADGRVVELTVMIRPLKGLQRVVGQMARALGVAPPSEK